MYSFLSVLVLYLYPKSNLDERKLKNEVSIELIDFLENDFPRNQRVLKLAMLEKFNEEYQKLYGKKISPYIFYKGIKQYCKLNGLYFNPHIKKKEKYDKSGSKEYYTIATSEDFIPPPEPGTQTTLL